MEGMSVETALARLRAPDRCLALILDNEVTVGEFVVTPPLSWVRLMQRGGVVQIADGYPTVLTAQQATFEMKNWDEVSLPSIVQMLQAVGEWADYVVVGNNAGQGLAIAKELPQDVISKRGVIIYAHALPEIDAYARLGYRTFHRRNEIIPRLLENAREMSRGLSLCFVNTIQHDKSNYHDP
jgi:hypothetical protein